MSILVNVVNQKMVASSCLNDIVAGSQEFVKFRFNLDKDWDDLATFAQFIQNGTAYNQYLDDENNVYLPAEIKAGTCTLMLYGINNATIGTTNYLTFKVNENRFISDAQSTNISQSLYQQLVSKISSVSYDLKKQVNNLKIQVTDFLNNDIIIDNINEAVSNEMAQYLSEGKLANLTIEDGSISRTKLDEDVNMALNCVGKVTPVQKVSDDLITINDISPITHSLKLQIKSQGKNLIDFNQIKSKDGTIATIIPNGFRVTGQRSAIIRDVPVVPHTNYTLSYLRKNVTENSSKFVYVSANINGTTVTVKVIRNVPCATFNTGDATAIDIQFFASESNIAETTEFTNIQLELGTEATEYEPYIVVSDITVRRYGKNMFDFHEIKTVNPTVAEIIKDGVRVTGTRAVKAYNIPVMPNTNYTLSFLRKNVTENSDKYVYVQGLIPSQSPVTLKNILGDVTSGTFNTGNATEINVEFFASRSNTTETVEFTNIQLELGTEATEYEPYVPVIEANVSEDGTVDGITSVYPNTVIWGDAFNVRYEYEYFKVLKEVLDNKLDNGIGSVKSGHLAEGCTTEEKLSADVQEKLNKPQILFDNTSNAIKGSSTGDMLQIDDVSPITHILKIKAQSKNLIDFTKIESNQYATSTIIENGFRITGSYYNAITNIPVLPNTDYYLSYVTNNISITTKCVRIFNNSNLELGRLLSGTGGIFNSGDNNMIKIYFYTSFDDTTTGTVEFTNIQLEKGTAATEYEPYVDISDMTVRRYGKNQFNSAKKMIASFGKTPEYIENGFRVTNRGVTSQVIPVFPNTDYNLSYILTEIEGTTEKHVTVYRYVNGIMSSAIKNFGNDIGGTFNTGNNTAIQIRFFGTPTSSDEGTVEFTNIQLEKGTAATEYEPYAVIEAEVAEDGTVRGLTSVYPTTVILGDMQGVVFECEYNRDLNKAFNKIIEAIVSLGGNV